MCVYCDAGRCVSAHRTGRDRIVTIKRARNRSLCAGRRAALSFFSFSLFFLFYTHRMSMFWNFPCMSVFLLSIAELYTVYYFFSRGRGSTGFFGTNTEATTDHTALVKFGDVSMVRARFEFFECLPGRGWPFSAGKQIKRMIG